MNRLENQTMALAAMFQAATLVNELAQHGSYDLQAFDCSFNSLFTIDADTTREALGDITCLSRGFSALADYLGGENRSPGRNIAYYLLSMLKISNQLLRNESLADKMLSGLQRIDSSSSDFNLSRTSVINKIDGLYQDCISSLSPRIIVRGEQNYLRNDDNAANTFLPRKNFPVTTKAGVARGYAAAAHATRLRPCRTPDRNPRH
jgi:high frequency lysogenization protein